MWEGVCLSRGGVRVSRPKKKKGTAFFRQSKFHAASAEYSRRIQDPALVRCSDLWKVLYCNRAVTRLRISQFEGALNDCQEVLRSDPEHQKALFLAARALYCLRRFNESHLLCKEFLALDAASGEGRSLLKATLRRLDESTAGNFDFSDMYNKARNQKYPRSDYGDYIGSVEVRACDQLSKGRGLFATRDIS
jgi:tetratricopeptide (TPR) repeat protein